jgi:hypothetical protein
MRRRSVFVNSDPTRYCAFLLGQSQDVDMCAICGKFRSVHLSPVLGFANRSAHASQASEGWQVGG